MKYWYARIAVLCMMILTTSCCAMTVENAEYTPLDLSRLPSDDAGDVVFDGIISFRGMEWYSTKASVEYKLSDQGGYVNTWSSDPTMIYRPDALGSVIMLGNEYINGGGYRSGYAGLTVAGYDKHGTGICYMYPIDEEGYLVENEEQAELYMGWYSFTTFDYSDIGSVYLDLNGKLAQLYGSGRSKTDEFKTQVTWTDKEGNMVRLIVDTERTSCVLAYIAANADTRLDRVAEARIKTNFRNEQNERESNTDNYSGL